LGFEVEGFLFFELVENLFHADIVLKIIRNRSGFDKGNVMATPTLRRGKQLEKISLLTADYKHHHKKISKQISFYNEWKN
jgi:hypothetical protein